MSNRRYYYLRQMLIGAAISMVMGTLLFFAAYHGENDLPFWGAHGLVADCLPQGFMVGLMSVLLPSLSAQRAMKRGEFPPSPSLVSRFLPNATLLRGFALALFSMASLTLLAATLATTVGQPTIGFSSALVLKALASFLLASIITPIALSAAFDTVSDN